MYLKYMLLQFMISSNTTPSYIITRCCCTHHNIHTPTQKIIIHLMHNQINALQFLITLTNISWHKIINFSLDLREIGNLDNCYKKDYSAHSCSALHQHIRFLQENKHQRNASPIHNSRHPFYYFVLLLFSMSNVDFH